MGPDTTGRSWPRWGEANRAYSGVSADASGAGADTMAGDGVEMELVRLRRKLFIARGYEVM